MKIYVCEACDDGFGECILTVRETENPPEKCPFENQTANPEWTLRGSRK